MRWNDRSRIGVAICASMLLHLAGGTALLLLAPRREGEPRPKPPFEVALVPRPEPLPKSSEPSAGSTWERRRPGVSKATEPRGETPGARPTKRAANAPGLGSNPPSGERVLTPAKGTREWMEAEGLAPGEAMSPRALLRPAPALLGPSRGEGGVGEEGEARDGGASDRERAEAIRARLDGFLEEVLAADRAHTLPDAYWSDLRGRLEEGFKVAWGVLDEGPRDDEVVSGGRVGESLVAWQREAELWASQGEQGPPRDPGELAAAQARRELAARELVGGEERKAALFLTELVARVELEQGPDGELAACRLVGTSGNAAYDELVLEHLRALAREVRARLGPPPAQGSRTRWAVLSRFELFPPMPLAGCSFDAQFRPAGCFYPLKRTVRTSFRLERVWVR